MTTNITNQTQSSSESKLPPSIEWQTLEYIHKQRSNDWFWAVGVVALGAAIASIMVKNYLFAVFSLLAGFTVALAAARKPKEVVYHIDHRGIKVGNVLYGFADISHFWIDYDPPHAQEIRIESKKKTMMHIHIPLGDTDPNEVREVLLNYLKEREIEDSWATILAKIFNLV